METIKKQIQELTRKQQTELAKFLADSLASTAETRTIEVATYGYYNSLRYSPPWAAVITHWGIKQPTLDFNAGNYLGSDRGGRLEVTCKVGDIVRYGQRDHRGNNTVAKWGIITNDWIIKSCTPAEAKDHWRTTLI